MAELDNPSNAREVEMNLHPGDLTEMLQNLALQGSIHFAIKKLRKSQAPEQTLSRSCRLMIPSWFVQKHGDKFHQTVVLRSGMSTVPCKVQLTVVYTTSGIPEIKLGRGWRDFATYNRLVVGDSLIFELRRMSEFAVHIFRATGNANGLPSSNAESKKCYTDSELSQKNGNDDSSAGYSSPQHILAAQRSGGSTDGVRDGTPKRIEIGEEGTNVSASTLQKSPCISLHQGPVLESLQMTPLQHDSQYFSQEPPIDHMEPSISRPDESAQITPPRKIHVRNEFQQPASLLLPSFTQRLVSYNVQDGVGNTCGAFFEVPSSFVMTHGILLQAAHVRLQGICEESPVRPVTAFHRNLHKPDDERHLYLGWGDFVRENVLRAGQELVFTLAAESFFEVREVRDTVI